MNPITIAILVLCGIIVGLIIGAVIVWRVLWNNGDYGL